MLLALLGLLCLAAPAHAQTSTYVNGTDGALDESTTCSNPLVRNFTVGSSFTVSDVDIGIAIQHSLRGGLRMTLQSPAGARVQIVDGNVSAIAGDNFNVRLNDQGTQTVNTDANNSSHSTAASPPFQHNFIPNNALSAFAGESSAGTWRLEVCNVGFWQQILIWSFYTGGTGTFRHAELYLTQVPAEYADLSLNMDVGGGSGNTVEYEVTVANDAASPSTATGVTVSAPLPSGVVYSSHSGGSYNSGTGLWTVGSLAPGESRTLRIVAVVTASSGTTVTTSAQVSASSVADIDSTPGNNAPAEDDQDSASFVSGTRMAGIPPTLICPAGTILFDWNGRSWTPGSTSNTYALAGLGNLSFQLTNPGSWLNLLGGTNPRLTTTVTGGLSPAQPSLAQTVDLATRNQVVTTEITLPVAVAGLQFTVFDVDYGANQFADRVRVTGTYGGAPVAVVLTNGVANYVVGNEAFGDALSGDTEAAGNVVVTFQSPVDTVVIEYGNHSAAPSNPGQQAITIHDITLCEPHTTLTVGKTSSVIGNPTQGTTDPAAIPGATIAYCILVTNGGSASATSVVATDPLPANMTFAPGSMRSGTDCASASTTEDDNATGADESNPFGASYSGGQVTFTIGTLAPAASAALRFNATVD